MDWSEPQFVINRYSHYGWDLDLEIDHLGNYHLAVSDESSNSIWYCKRVDSMWAIIEKATDAVPSVYPTGGISFSMSLYGTFPVIMFIDSSFGYLKWTMRTGSTWMTPELVTGASASYFVKCIVDTDANMHAIWLKKTGTPNELFYSRTTGSAWTHERICTVTYPGYDHLAMDIALDSNNTPHFIWWDTGPDAVFYAVRTGPNLFDIHNIASANDCRWMKLVMLDGDIPYMGWRNRPTSDYSVLHERFRIGSSFYGGAVTVLNFPVNSTDMVIAADEGVTTSNIYYLYTCWTDQTRLGYVHWVPGTGWVNEIIFQGSANRFTGISATWDRVRKSVGVAYRHGSSNNVYFMTGSARPTPTANPTASPTPAASHTPTPVHSPSPTPTLPPGCDINLDLGPNRDYSAGDWMIGELRVENPGAARNIDVYILLDVFGEIWFAPAWNRDPDCYYLSLMAGEYRDVLYLPAFRMPDPLPAGGPFYFYAAAFIPETLDIMTILSNIAVMEFNLI